ncbi:tetratricopeptide repeat protein [Thermoflexibacter ruber]|uniref:TPR repeat-containing protein n=1 Tax=Thermoflexibacter ruber TaxID=1003 RepID=A0A1I2JKW5_9BACT|nr:tetratricopeptide repeat protein [Thermoflexibacter ruber]SFF54899.1 TPR repeat-containing protein [Thermoflexibacter ruber]
MSSLKVFLFLTITLLLSNWSEAQPPKKQDFSFEELYRQRTYRNFIGTKKLLIAKALHLPASTYWLVLAAVERTEDRELWSMDKADRTEAKIFVYEQQSKQIDEKLTEAINIKLGWDKYYEPLFCGGLGSLAEKDFKIVGNKITLTQFYAPATERSNCTVEILFRNGEVVVQKLGLEDTSLEAITAKERTLANQKALALLHAGKTHEAVLIWEDLYVEWKHGAFPKAGAVDEVLNNLGFAYWKLNMYPEAEKILLECKKNFPQRKSVYLNLADLYRDMKKKNEAVFHYQQFINMGVTELQKNYASKEIKKLQN